MLQRGEGHRRQQGHGVPGGGSGLHPLSALPGSQWPEGPECCVTKVVLCVSWIWPGWCPALESAHLCLRVCISATPVPVAVCVDCFSVGAAVTAVDWGGEML